MKCDLQFGLDCLQIRAANDLVHDRPTGRTEGRQATAGSRFLKVICNLTVRFARTFAAEAVAMMQRQLAPRRALLLSKEVLEHMPYGTESESRKEKIHRMTVWR